MFYVYRFLNSDYEVIYVGRTNQLKNRMSTHFGAAGHLPKECYNSVKRVDYVELGTRSDMNILELYFISKYRPKYNTVANHSGSNVEINELKYSWVTFNREIQQHPLDQEKQRYRSEIAELRLEVCELKRELMNNKIHAGAKVALPKSVLEREERQRFRCEIAELKHEISNLEQELANVNRQLGVEKNKTIAEEADFLEKIKDSEHPLFKVSEAILKDLEAKCADVISDHSESLKNTVQESKRKKRAFFRVI